MNDMQAEEDTEARDTTITDEGETTRANAMERNDGLHIPRRGQTSKILGRHPVRLTRHRDT
jgi:hypothetical protein